MKLTDALERWTSDFIMNYVSLLGGKSTITRKADRIAFIRAKLLNPDTLRQIWAEFDPITRRAISDAYHNDGIFDSLAFEAQYGELPPRPRKSIYSYYGEPILFDLFIINNEIPDDLRPLLSDLVLPVERHQIRTVLKMIEKLDLGDEELPVQVVETEIAGRADLLTYLQMVDQQQIKWSSSGQLTSSSVRKVMSHLVDGDFIREPEKMTQRHVIRPVGLDTFARGAGLVSNGGRLSPMGRAYLQTQDSELIREAFEQWAETSDIDELQRITHLKGMNSHHTRLTHPASRREKIIEALSWCPTDAWINNYDFHRAILIWRFDFDVEETRAQNLYVGSVGNRGNMTERDYWTIVKGQYIDAILMQSLGSIGALDVGYLEYPFSMLDTDWRYIEESYSLHQGLLYFRINPWGAFLLGQADTYEPTAPRQKDLFTIDEERRLTLVANLLPNERLQLETMCEKVDERTMRLDQEKLLTAVESGIPFEQLSGFLRSNHRGPLPDPIEQWLARLEDQIGLFRQGGDAVVIKLRRKKLRALVEEDEVLAGLCYPIDARRVVVMSGNVTRFRNRLKELGYLLQ